MSLELLILSGLYILFALPLSVMDCRKFRISLPLVFLGSLILLCARFLFLKTPFISFAENMLLALGTSFLVYFGTRVLSGDELGFGDVFFGMFSALYTGFYMNIIATVFAALSGVLYYLLLAIMEKYKKKQTMHRPIFAIPFVPFITFGAVLSSLLFNVLF